MTERLVAEIDEDLKRRAKVDPRPIKEIVEKSLQTEFATAATAAIERRIDEKRQRIETLRSEINRRERELADVQDELERLQAQLERHDAQQDQWDEAREKLRETPRDTDNPAIQQWADKLGVSPQELIDELSN